MQKFFTAVVNVRNFAHSAVTRANALLCFLSAVLMMSTSAGSMANSFTDEELLSEGAVAVVDDRPVVYLTFDDGPSADKVTDELLHVLARHNATATFFVTGHRVRQAQDKVAEIVYAGHAIGNHTLSHAKLTEVSDKKALSELKTASEIILSAGGPPATCFRPPFGSTDRRINNLASRLGMVPVGWSIDTRDWERTTSVDQITQALNRVSAEAVVLLHDGPSYRGKMLNAFSSWMDSEAHRFQFRALPECTASGVLQLAEIDLPLTPPTATGSSATASSPAESSSTVETNSEPAAQNEAPVASAAAPAAPAAKVYATIPELLAKIRAYRFELYDDGQRVDLSQVTATLNTEIHGDHVFYSF